MFERASGTHSQLMVQCQYRRVPVVSSRYQIIRSAKKNKKNLFLHDFYWVKHEGCL